jgi:RHS repeat-associated protein
VASGEVVLTQTDLRRDGVLPLILSRTHVSSYRVGRMFGRSWASTLDQRLEVDRDGVCYAAADGMLLQYPTPAGDQPVWPVAGPRLALTATLYGYQISDAVRGRTLHFGRPGPDLREGVSSWPLTAATDRTGNRIDLEYGEGEELVAVRHSSGYHVAVDSARGRITGLRLTTPDGGDHVVARYRYDDLGQLTEVVNSSGESMVFDYDADGRLISWQDRIGGWHRFDYDPGGRCVRTTGADRMLERRLSYDLSTRTTTVTDSLGHTSGYVCNERGQVVRRTDELGRVTVLEWDRYDRLRSRTDPLGRATSYRYDDDGNLTRVIRPDGGVVALTYNAMRQPISVTAADQTVRRFDYDHLGNLTAVTDELGAVTRYGYEWHGRLASVAGPTGAGYRLVTDPAGLPVQVTDPTGAATQYQRDAFGRPARITDALGGTAELGWTVEGKLAWRRLPDGALERWRYDAEGNLLEQVDPAGGVTRFEIGQFGLVTVRTDPDGSRLEFDYDTELRLTAVTNPQGLVWRYEYDPAGQLVAETDFNRHTIRYRHDAAGQLVARTNGAGQTLQYRHDPLGNLVEQRSDSDELTTFRYDPAGQLTHTRNGDAEVAIDFDPAGRVVAETCNAATVASHYDAAGRRVQRRTPSGAEATWSYDPRGLPVALHTAGHAMSFSHDPAGRETARHLDTAVNLAQTWDANHRLVAQTLAAATSGTPRVIARRQWSYRPDGRPTGVDEDLGGPRRFDLDTAGRITAVHGGNWTERYTYDPAGNLIDATWPASGTDTLDADTQGAREYAGTLITRAGRVRYEHDECGRVTLRQQKRLSGKPLTWRYTWNAEDRLTSVTTPDGTVWRYRYDPLGRRIAKLRLDAAGTVVEQVDFRWDGPVLAEQTRHVTADTDRAAHDHITVWDWAPGTYRPLTQSERTTMRDAPQEVIDQRFYAIVTDLVATPTELVDTDGNIAWRHQPTLWGGTTAATGPADCPFRFPGQYHDPETGAHYNVHRYYDPTTARYHTPDPLGLTPAPNPHTYVPNPQVGIDPLGLDPGGGEGPVRDFAHGTTPASAESITTGGLNEAAGRDLTTGGRYAQPGAFHTFEVTPTRTEGLQVAYEMGLKNDQTGSVVTILRLPASTFDALAAEGHVRVESIPGVDIPQTVFLPGGFPRINLEGRWLPILKPGG